MADLIDKTAAVQIMARVAAGRMRMKDAQDAITALPAQGVRVLTEAQIDAALDAMEANMRENGADPKPWRDIPADDREHLRSMARAGILAALAPAEAGGVDALVKAAEVRGIRMALRAGLSAVANAPPNTPERDISLAVFQSISALIGEKP